MVQHGRDIVFDGVSKSYGEKQALHDVSFTARAGAVTGFVGRNGAGKTTALRILLGLSNPDSGTASIGGVAVSELPPGTVGAALGPHVHPGRTGRTHLRVLADALRLGDEEVDALLEDLDLTADAKKRAGKYSLGMNQRLALGGALLGAPPVLVLDEPVNGLDPDGVAWLRKRLRDCADAGGTVLLSSHLLSELELVADDIVLLDQRVLWAGPLVEVAAAGGLEALYQSVTATAPVHSSSLGGNS